MMTLTGDEVICTYVENSVIRFGDILPLWQNCTNLWQLFECLISMCQTFEPTLENSVWFWANLRCCKWSKIGQTFSVSGHTGRERGRRQTERKKERKEQSGKWKWNGNVSFRTTIFKEGVWNGLICHCLEFVTPLSLSHTHSLSLSLCVEDAYFGLNCSRIFRGENLINVFLDLDPRI